jgi:hypothetical protein
MLDSDPDEMNADPQPWKKPSSVADRGYLSRIMIFFHPESRIQQEQTEEGENLCHTFCKA